MSMTEHIAPRHPRRDGDLLLLGKGFVLARRLVVQGCWETEEPPPEALQALLGLAYPAETAPALTKTIQSAIRVMTRNERQADQLLAGLPEPHRDCEPRLLAAQALLRKGVAPAALSVALRRASLGLPEAPAYSPALRLTDRGVVLGKGTVIAALIDHPGGTALAIDGQEERILTLLSVARQELVDPDRILRGLQTVSRALQKGDTSLAAIALCQLGQPPLTDERLAKTLTWADNRLAKGRPALTLLKMQGLLRETITFGKIYTQHVPAGNGRQSGQFAPKDSSVAGMTPEQKKAELDKLNDAHDKALLAAHTYGEGTPLPPGYRQVTDPDELAKLGITQGDLSPSESGMMAEVFVKDGPNGPKYVVAFRGTQSLNDWNNNLQQGLGYQSAEYEDAAKLAEKLKGANVDLSFTGHSLGGGLASAAAVATGYSATTFNAAGLDATQSGPKTASTPHVEAYYVDGEPLSAIQDNRVATVPAALAVLGFVPYVGEAAVGAVGGTLLGRELGGNKVMPQAYGARNQLPAAKPAGTGDYIINRHSMSWVLSGIEARQKQLSR